MSLAADTRTAARRHPWLIRALEAGVVNYTAAARYLDVDGDTDAVATALRRYAEGIGVEATGEARVSMRSGVARVETGEAPAGESVLSVGEERFRTDGGSLTAIVARGSIDSAAIGTVGRRLAVADVPVAAAGATEGRLTVVVERRHGADALRVVEDELSA